jgi:hypothetical protein
VREVLDRLKTEFSRHRETPGLVVLETPAGKLEVTWSWQHVRVEGAGMLQDVRERLIEVLAEFNCVAHLA